MAGADAGTRGGITHYQLLGVTTDATHAEIKRAYHDLARRHHPDARPHADQAGAEQARLIMARLNAAWAVLGEPARRQAYDAQLGLRPDRAHTAWRPLDDAEPEQEDHVDPLLEDDYDPAPATPADLVVLVPVALLGLAVAAFAVSVLTQSPMWMWVSIVLVPVAGVAFVATPLAVMFVRVRARSRT